MSHSTSHPGYLNDFKKKTFVYIKVYSLCCKVLWLLTNTSYLIFAVTVSYRMISPSGLVVNFSLLDFIPEILLALSLECIYNLRIYCLCCCLVLPSCFSRARLCATPQTAAHRAPPSLGFSRQEYWSGVPLPSPIYMRPYININR